MASPRAAASRTRRLRAAGVSAPRALSPAQRRPQSGDARAPRVDLRQTRVTARTGGGSECLFGGSAAIHSRKLARPFVQIKGGRRLAARGQPARAAARRRSAAWPGPLKTLKFRAPVSGAPAGAALPRQARCRRDCRLRASAPCAAASARSVITMAGGAPFVRRQSPGRSRRGLPGTAPCRPSRPLHLNAVPAPP
jgi:hypothetical protein